jgi:hypothetical protein
MGGQSPGIVSIADCILQQLSDPPRIEPFVELDENIAGQRIGRDSID